MIVDRTSRYWGNPFTVADAAAEGHEYPQLAVVELHADWLLGDGPDLYIVRGRRFSRSWVLNHLHELRGRDLACFCAPEDPCHADFLLTLANRPARKPIPHGAGPKPYGFPERCHLPAADLTVKGAVL